MDNGKGKSEEEDQSAKVEKIINSNAAAVNLEGLGKPSVNNAADLVESISTAEDPDAAGPPRLNSIPTTPEFPRSIGQTLRNSVGTGPSGAPHHVELAVAMGEEVPTEVLAASPVLKATFELSRSPLGIPQTTRIQQSGSVALEGQGLEGGAVVDNMIVDEVIELDDSEIAPLDAEMGEASTTPTLASTAATEQHSDTLTPSSATSATANNNNRAASPSTLQPRPHGFQLVPVTISPTAAVPPQHVGAASPSTGSSSSSSLSNALALVLPNAATNTALTVGTVSPAIATATGATASGTFAISPVSVSGPTLPLEIPSPPAPTHSLTWAMAGEKGYMTMRTQTGELVQNPIHPDLEDVCWPTMEARGLTAEGFGRETQESFESALREENAAARGLDDLDVQAHKRKDVEMTESSSTSQPPPPPSPGQIPSVPIAVKTNPVMVTSGLDDEPREARAARSSLLQSLHYHTTGCTPHSRTTRPRVYVLADGHGGINAARFFVPRIRDEVYALVVSRTWDLSHEDDRRRWSVEVGSVFRAVDAEYVAVQVEAYRKWKEEGSVYANRPLDDGCTMVVTVFMSGWCVNMNVGDSRTVIWSRPKRLPAWEKTLSAVAAAAAAANSSSPGSTNASLVTAAADALSPSRLWAQEFSSVDHNMSHPGKVWDIHQSGGQFICPPGAARPLVVEPPDQRQHRPYHELNGGRIFRQVSDPVKTVGVSHRRTLNLTATMGDLLFKINPPVLSPLPDIHFMKMEQNRDYLMVMATDGIWDHLLSQASVLAQNEAVLRVVSAAVDVGEREETAAASSSSNSNSGATGVEVTGSKGLQFRLRQASACLAFREAVFAAENDDTTTAAITTGATSTDPLLTLPPSVKTAVTGMYAQRLPRYDDATAFVVLLKG